MESHDGISPTDSLAAAIDPAVQAQVRAHLERIAGMIDKIQLHAASVLPMPPDAVLAQHRGEFYATMIALGGWINGYLAGNPPPDEVKAVRAQVAAPIQAWSATSPVFNRVVHPTARGPRDFELPELVLANRRAGANLPALIFNDFYLHTIATQAFRNRFAMLTRRLLREVAQRTQAGADPVQVLNLKCDSGGELVTLVNEPEFSAAQITCLDEDPAALRAARAKLEERLPTKARFLRVNALRYARSPLRPSQPYDISYAVALFGHLSADQAVALIRDCYGLLAAGGVLVLGSPTTSIPANERVLGAWLMDVVIHYRDESDVERLFAQTPFGSETLQFERKPSGGDMLVIAQRL